MNFFVPIEKIMDAVLWDLLRYSEHKHWSRLCFLNSLCTNHSRLVNWYYVLRCYDYEPCEIVCWLSDHYLTLWIKGRECEHKIAKEICKCNRESVYYPLLTADHDLKEVLPQAVRYGRLDLIKWLVGEFELEANKGLFDEAAQRGHVDVCQWLMERFGLLSSPSVMMIYAARGGYVRVCEWLDETFLIDYSTDHHGALRTAASEGKLTVVKWFVEKYNPARNIILETNWGAFQWASGYGHLDVCQWFTTHYNITKDDEGIRDGSGVRFALTCGQLEILQWAIPKFEIEYRSHILTLCTFYGRISILKWIVEYYGLTKDDICADNCLPIHRAIINGQVKTLKWLTETFGLTRGDIANHIDEIKNSEWYRENKTCRDWVNKTFDIKK